MKPPSRKRAAVLTVLISSLVSLIVLEALLWLVPLPDPYPVDQGRRFHRYLAVWNHWRWNIHGKYDPPFEEIFNPGILKGVEPGPVHIRVNRYGFLFPVEKSHRSSKEEIRIGVIGGSTVECIVLKPEKRWPAVLERLLRENLKNRPVTVLNLGISDQATPTHLSTVAQLAVKLDLDVLVFMLGANDLHRASGEWSLMMDDKNFYRIERSRPDLLRLLITRTQLGRRIQALKRYITSSKSADTLPYFHERLLKRMKLPLLDFEPRFSEEALRDYEKDIISLAALSESHGIRVLFLTQPMLWKEVPLPEEEKVDWMGIYRHQGRLYRLKSRTSSRLLETLNRKLLETCRKMDYDCLDLAGIIPRSLDVFYDPVHFNEKGAELVAISVRDALLSKKIIGPSTNQLVN
jgi:lysophospholipase L1-like esterase